MFYLFIYFVLSYLGGLFYFYYTNKKLQEKSDKFSLSEALFSSIFSCIVFPLFVISFILEKLKITTKFKNLYDKLDCSFQNEKVS